MKLDPDISRLSTLDLLRLSGQIGEVLRERRITRTSKIVGDYAEYLFVRAFGWQPSDNPSNKGHDAVHRGQRYQIKSRRCTARNPSRILGDLKAFDEARFDHLAVLIFNEDFSVHRAAILDHATVHRLSIDRGQGARRLTMNDIVWTRPGVRDVTERLRVAQVEF